MQPYPRNILHLLQIGSYKTEAHVLPISHFVAHTPCHPLFPNLGLDLDLAPTTTSMNPPFMPLPLHRLHRPAARLSAVAASDDGVRTPLSPMIAVRLSPNLIYFLRHRRAIVTRPGSQYDSNRHIRTKVECIFFNPLTCCYGATLQVEVCYKTRKPRLQPLRGNTKSTDGKACNKKRVAV